MDDVGRYKFPASSMIDMGDNKKLFVRGFPVAGKSGVLLVVSTPGVLDVIEGQLGFLKNPSSWSLLLHLKTTESGKLVDNFLPASGKNLTNFKIEFLRSFLSKKPLLLKMNGDDFSTVIKLIQKISSRERIQKIKLEEPEKMHSLAAELFGYKVVPGAEEEDKKTIVEKLNRKGVVYIENVEFLSKETQEEIASFLYSGSFKPFGTNRTIESDVRFIFATSADPKDLIKKDKLLKFLFEQLKGGVIEIPKLAELERGEFSRLVDEMVKQIIGKTPLGQIAAINEKEKGKLKKNISSVYMLRKSIYKLLLKKSKAKGVVEDLKAPLDLSQESDLLTHAMNLGKEALKDREVMTALWNKFKNQSEIASYLGVNRSSVHRWCKKYQLV